MNLIQEALQQNIDYLRRRLSRPVRDYRRMRKNIEVLDELDLSPWEALQQGLITEEECDEIMLD